MDRPIDRVTDRPIDRPTDRTLSQIPSRTSIANVHRRRPPPPPPPRSRRTRGWIYLRPRSRRHPARRHPTRVHARRRRRRRRPTTDDRRSTTIDDRRRRRYFARPRPRVLTRSIPHSHTTAIPSRGAHRTDLASRDAVSGADADDDDDYPCVGVMTITYIEGSVTRVRGSHHDDDDGRRRRRRRTWTWTWTWSWSPACASSHARASHAFVHDTRAVRRRRRHTSHVVVACAREPHARIRVSHPTHRIRRVAMAFAATSLGARSTHVQVRGRHARSYDATARARCRARKEGDVAVRARAGRGRERCARDEANGVRSRAIARIRGARDVVSERAIAVAIARGRAGFGVEARGM